MGKLRQELSSRFSFSKEIYKWGWRWVVAIIWALPYGLAGLYDLLQGQEYLPNSWLKLSHFIPVWAYWAWLAIGVLLFIGITFEGAYRIVKTNLLNFEGNEDEISKVIKQLSELPMQIKGDNKNYACMLMECADKLAVGGITIEPTTPDPAYRILSDGTSQWVERPLLKGMVHSQLLGFLQQLVIEGIVERKIIGGAPYYEETFYFTEFGRQVINHMKRLKEKN
jgi:hypothetical protein